MTPVFDYMHALWAALAVLFWRLWDANDKRIALLEKNTSQLLQTSERHTTLHELTSEAILDLRQALKENTSETRKGTEAIIRVETILAHATRITPS